MATLPLVRTVEVCLVADGAKCRRMPVSASKARMTAEINELEVRLWKANRQIVVLLQALVDIENENPGVELPNLAGEFPEWIWREINI